MLLCGRAGAARQRAASPPPAHRDTRALLDRNALAGRWPRPAKRAPAPQCDVVLNNQPADRRGVRGPVGCWQGATRACMRRPKKRLRLAFMMAVQLLHFRLHCSDAQTARGPSDSERAEGHKHPSRTPPPRRGTWSRRLESCRRNRGSSRRTECTRRPGSGQVEILLLVSVIVLPERGESSTSQREGGPARRGGIVDLVVRVRQRKRQCLAENA